MEKVEGWDPLRRPVWGLLWFLAGLNSTKIVAFHKLHTFSLPLGLQGSDGDTANNQEWGVNPSHHCQWDHIRVTASPFISSYSTSLIHDSVVCIWLEVSKSVLSPISPPPHPTELYYRRCLWASWQDVRPTRTSKPLRVNVLLLTMTFSTLIGLTSQTHAKLGLQYRTWMIYIGAVDQFPSWCGSNSRIRAQSVMGNHPQDGGAIPVSQKGFLNINTQSHLLPMLGQFQKKNNVRWSGERKQTIMVPILMLKLQIAHTVWLLKKCIFNVFQNLTNAKSHRLRRSGSTPNSWQCWPYSRFF